MLEAEGSWILPKKVRLDIGLLFFFFLNLYIFPIVKAFFITVSVINKKQERIEEVVSLNPRIHQEDRFSDVCLRLMVVILSS